jgi:hypothetical protein
VTASVVPPQVLQFVREVRAALDDLAPEEVDELTEGLAADLSEGVDESPSLGDPAAYAAELRAAAGLPPREPRPDPSALATVATLDRRALDAAGAWLARQGWWPPVRDFLVDLRPAWWVARGWAFWELVRPVEVAMGSVLPTTTASAAVLALFVVASAQFGRRTRDARGGRRVVVTAVNVVAVLCLVPALTVATSQPEPPAPVAPVTTAP